MERQELLRKMTSLQFAAFEVQLYLDTHPQDKSAIQTFNKYRKSCEELQKQYENLYGPLNSDSMSKENWDWISNPWPWEKEAN